MHTYKLYRETKSKITMLVSSLVLVGSSVGAAIPLLLSHAATAAPATAYTSTPFSSETWAPDRTAPSGGSTVTGDTMQLKVDNTAANTTATFYQTEGLQTTFPAQVASVKASLTVPSDWQSKPVKAGMWAVASESSDTSEIGWPIIQFVSDQTAGGFTGWRVYNTFSGGWTYTTVFDTTNGWNKSYALEISYNPVTNNFDFFVDNALLTSYSATDGTDSFDGIQGVIFDNYNSATNDSAQDYTVDWNGLSTGTFFLATPTDLTPADGTYTNNPAFADTWSVVPGATGYEYRTSNSLNGSGLGTVIYSDSTTSQPARYSAAGGTETRQNGGTPAGTYYWQVRATGPNGTTSEWSAINKVVVDTSAPTPPELQTPANNGYETTNSFNFDWKDSTDTSPLHYEWQASLSNATNADGSFQNILASHDNLTDSEVASPGTPDNSYFWHVRAIDAAGNATAWTDTWKVTVDTQAAATPTGLTLKDSSNHTITNGGATNSYSVTAGWTGASDADHYVYRVWDNIAGNTYNGEANAYVVDNAGTSRTGDFNQGEGVYTVEVASVDAAGNQSVWSAPFTVTYDKTAPVASLSAPTNGATVHGSVQVTGTVGDANPGHYYLVVKNTHGTVVAGPGTVDSSNPSVSYVWDTTKQADGTYTIDLEARDAAGNKDGGSVKTITVKVDNTAPVVSVDALSTTDTTPTVTGTVDDSGANVAIQVNGHTYGATVTGNTWSADVTDALPLGTYDVAATATDTVGNVGSDSTTNELTITAPQAQQPPQDINNTNVTFRSTNRQVATTGNATDTNNTTGGDATTGDATNTNNSVLGANTDSGKVKGDSTVKLENAGAKKQGTFAGLGWWWLAVIVALAGIWLALARRRHTDD